MGVKTRALKSLHSAWTKKIHGMRQMDAAANVLPQNPYEVFGVEEGPTDEWVTLNCGPAVFELRERAGAKRKIYVVVKGSISVQESNARGGPLQTMCFTTNVAYFRAKRDRLEHVYGVHYDMDMRGGGHPVFHAQLGPVAELAGAIRDRFHVDGIVCNRVRPILRNVRTPTAQMDFFSVFTQLCADHLMSLELRNSSGQVTEAFKAVRRACNCLRGAAHRLSYLNGGEAPECYRSSHWYCGL